MIKEKVKSGEISPKQAIETLTNEGGQNSHTMRWLKHRLNGTKPKQQTAQVKKSRRPRKSREEYQTAKIAG